MSESYLTFYTKNNKCMLKGLGDIGWGVGVGVAMMILKL